MENIKEKKEGFCMLLGEPCYKECPNYYFKEVNGCFKK